MVNFEDSICFLSLMLAFAFLVPLKGQEFPTEITSTTADLNKIYCSYRTKSKDHFFTVSFNEHLSVITSEQGSTVDQGFLGFVAITKKCECMEELNRYYNANGMDHFYTMNKKEMSTLDKLGYSKESRFGFVAPNEGCGNATLAVHRFYNPSIIDHHFVTEVEETLDFLRSDSGYTDENVQFYIWPSRDALSCGNNDADIQFRILCNQIPQHCWDAGCCDRITVTMGGNHMLGQWSDENGHSRLPNTKNRPSRRHFLDAYDLVKAGELYYDAFDFVVSFSSIEHSGLGRYGDPFDPIGDIREIQKEHCILKPGGLFFLGIPVGQDDLGWNCHRTYGRLRLPFMFVGFELLNTFFRNELPLELEIDYFEDNHGGDPLKSMHFVYVLKKIH